jgi:hypothetical protein
VPALVEEVVVVYLFRYKILLDRDKSLQMVEMVTFQKLILVVAVPVAGFNFIVASALPFLILHWMILTHSK